MDSKEFVGVAEDCELNETAIKRKFDETKVFNHIACENISIESPENKSDQNISKTDLTFDIHSESQKFDGQNIHLSDNVNFDGDIEKKLSNEACNFEKNYGSNPSTSLNLFSNVLEKEKLSAPESETSPQSLSENNNSYLKHTILDSAESSVTDFPTKCIMQTEKLHHENNEDKKCNDAFGNLYIETINYVKNHTTSVQSLDNFLDEEKVSVTGGGMSQNMSESNECENFEITTCSNNLTSCGSSSTGSSSESLQQIEQLHHENTEQKECAPNIQIVDNEYVSLIQYYEAQFEMMKSNNMKLQSEISQMQRRFQSQEMEWKATESRLRSDFLSKIDLLSKERATLQKDKESMVIRYANSEKEVILEKKVQSDLERKIKEIIKERENLYAKVKGLTLEKSRLSSIIDSKTVDLTKVQKENEKLKEDFSARDIKIKWLQNKLKMETSSHKETQNKLEYNMQRINEMREEAEQVRRDCQEMIKRYQDAEELKSIKLDGQLKQKLTELEVQKQEKSDQEQVYHLLRHELEALKRKQRLTIEENNCLTLKIHGLEKERLEYEQTLSKLKDSQNLLKQEVVDLAAQLTEMENLQLQLEREKDKSAASLREVDRLRSTNAELQADMDACHVKEGELLEFTKIVTQKTVQLQSDHSLLEIRAQALEDENTQLNRQFMDLQVKYLELSENLENAQKERQEETQLLARKLAEKTRIVEQLNAKLDEAENENRVMRKRHIASIKELSRELQQCKHKIESFELNKCAPEESVSLGSRASSTTSLEVIPSCSPFGNNTNSETEISPPVAFTGGKKSLNVYDKKTTVLSSMVSDVVDKKTLIDRIIRLQEVIARKDDKIEFLEDHTEQLVQEMKKKTKIIQSYIVKEEAGALTSNSSDENKYSKGNNKLLLCKRGGIMASVYTSLLSDSNMTLDLSLEINQKLQAVLEDTLLKNITLKENVNTLGEEIARLTTEHRQFSKQLKRQKNVK